MFPNINVLKLIVLVRCVWSSASVLVLRHSVVVKKTTVMFSIFSSFASLEYVLNIDLWWASLETETKNQQQARFSGTFNWKLGFINKLEVYSENGTWWTSDLTPPKTAAQKLTSISSKVSSPNLLWVFESDTFVAAMVVVFLSVVVYSCCIIIVHFMQSSQFIVLMTI